VLKVGLQADPGNRCCELRSIIHERDRPAGSLLPRYLKLVVLGKQVRTTAHRLRVVLESRGETPMTCLVRHPVHLNTEQGLLFASSAGMDRGVQ